MPTFALQQVSSTFARENAARTLHKPVALRFVARHDPAIAAQLTAFCPDGVVYVWGAKAERSHQTSKVVVRDALVFFRRGDTIYKRGVVVETTTNEVLAESLWGRDTDGEAWSNIFFFAKITDMNRPASWLNEHLGRSVDDHWQGLVVLHIRDTPTVRAFMQRELN